ncbi:hypothetical protein [Adhaeretor mobilis]|uniref:DUF1570 domain-containing protein n=1 Tax=Adhaeretor mobilis TaxID=1930276 RepID=A0A517MY62_9BACT|nr:hypothetical protein [Adhaeretor mobilis]QDS99820.1 hypothetical protein HG15A2_31510 [Adhaeretor mobilis]
MAGEMHGRRELSRRGFLLESGAALAACGIAATPGIATSAKHPGWLDHRQYGPFQIAATFPLAAYDRDFAELGHLEFELQRTLSVPPAKRPVDVYLLESAQAHRRYLQQVYPRVPYRRALYVQRGTEASVYAYQHKELSVDLRHECTHALLHSNLAMVPLWLDEGLAEYFEMPATQRAFGHPHLSRLRWDLRLGRIRKINSLEQARDLREMGPAEYRFAWAWTHFMLHGPAVAHRTLVAFLTDIRRGNPPGRLSERLNAEVPHLETRMAQHFKHWRR